MQSATLELRTATLADVPALRRNWSASFSDPDDYLDFFFIRRFKPEQTLVAYVDGTAVSQLFLLPAGLRTRDGMLGADYLFAAATHPDYRGRGIMTALLAKARAFCTERGRDAIVLLPGSWKLYNYYAKCGYETAFVRRRWDVTRESLARLAVSFDENADVCSVLQKILSGRDGLYWDADALGYALAEHRAFRGAVKASDHAFVSVSGSDAVCLSAPRYFGECAALLLDMSDLPRFSVTFPADVPFGTVEDGGMLCCLGKETIQLRDAFISFAME